MLIPILMVFLPLVLPQSVSRWANVVVAGFFFLFNLVGLPTYASLYDKFLLMVAGVQCGHDLVCVEFNGFRPSSKLMKLTHII